jgi:hypothetical protein
MNNYIIMSSVKNFNLDVIDKTKHELINITKVINKIHKNDIISSVEVIPPNEFQGIFSSLKSSIEAIFNIEECIIENNLDIKLKHIIFHDLTKSSQSKYTAFEKLNYSFLDARTRLQNLKKTDSRFLIALNNEKTSIELNNLFLIYEDYIDSWKKNDFGYINAFLNNMNYKEVASLFNINISNGWRKERNLKMKQYYTVKEMILSNID